MSLPAILTASAALENANLVALGINHAFDEPPEVLLDYPVAVRYAESTQQMEASDLMGRYNLFNFKIEVHLARGVLQESYANVLPMIRRYQNLYAANLSIGGQCDVSGFREPACSGPVYVRYGTGTTESLAVIFYMWAKEILDDITVELGAPMPEEEMAYLLETGQTTCRHVLDDGDYEIGIDKSYTVLSTGEYSGNTNIEVAHYAGNQISFTLAGSVVADVAAGLVTFLAGDTVVVKGSTLNDGVYTVAVGGVAGQFTTVEALVNEAAGAYVSLYKRTAHSNNAVDDDSTDLMWSRNTSMGEAVGEASTGHLDWLDAAGSTFIIYNAANTISVIMPGNIIRIIGGAALTQFHVGDLLDCAGFANAVNNLPGYYVVSVTVNGADLDIVVDPGNQVLIAEGAVGDSIRLVCRSIHAYCAGARSAGLSNLTDWRVPNINELCSLMEFTPPTAIPDVVAFPVWPVAAEATGGVWSSTSSPLNTVNAIQAVYRDGNTNTIRAKVNRRYAALVRG